MPAHSSSPLRLALVAPEALCRLTETSFVFGANYPGNEWCENAYVLVQDHAAGVQAS